MVTPEEVSHAYKLFLGREPENSEVVAGYCENAQTLDQLSRIFMSSPEFMRRMGSALEKPQANTHRHPFNLPKIPVETQVPPHILGQMFERIHKEWENLGATEPYWSIVTQPQNYMAEFEKNRDLFFASGNSTCQNFLATLRRSGINPAQLSTCLELGCGVGRVTRYLADAFDKVIAVDISAKHLALAKAHLAEQGVYNVDLQHWHNVDPMRQLPQVDVIMSVITLQHNPPPIMVWMISTLLSHLRPGGVAYLQIPTYRNGYLFEVDRYLASTPPDTLEMHYLPQPDVFKVVAQANCQCLEVREDGMVANEDQTLSNTFLVQKLLTP
ncbi:class I SAM-dependent methyltransferase [Limnohabitans sp.]|uniref:class I SAM-dependent methyltransferase n=1 Tax=Limnohabitans sp. TaxID=1907725 RepID=UPI0038BDA041